MTKSLTLLELIISIAIMSIIVLGFTSLDLYSRHNVLQADRRARVQNTLSYALDHMTKNIASAIGNEKMYGAYTVVNIVGNVIAVYIDANGNGQREVPVSSPGSTVDHWTAYRYDSTGANANQLRYCSRCVDDSGTCDFSVCMDTVNTLSKNISTFSPSVTRNADLTLKDNYVTVQLTGRWKMPDASSQDNPENTMLTRIKMWGVSTN